MNCDTNAHCPTYPLRGLDWISRRVGQSTTPTARNYPSTMAKSPTRVLLVDDDPVMLRLLRCWLEADGYEVSQASDGRQALLDVQRQCPDILLTDWEMPDLDGIALCRQLRAMNLPHYVYMLLLTGNTKSRHVVDGLEAGADDFVAKPVARQELLARLNAGSRVIELERRLSRAACTDHLTGLFSRRAFFDMLSTEWQRSRRVKLPLSCVMCDIDFFKRINDVHGHATGDKVIKAVAGLLADNCRGSDTVSRHGGEEFCVMLPETDERNAVEWAERTRHALAGLVMEEDDKEIRLTGSFGIAAIHDDTRSPEELVDQADQALLCAKQSGRDRVVSFGELAENAELDLQDEGKNEDLFHGFSARHVMTPLVACLRTTETLGQAAGFFLRARTNSAPVVDDKGKLLGMLSEKDLMAAMVSLDSWQLPVAEIMKPNVIVYDEDTPIRTVYEFLCRVSIRRIIVARDGSPVGAISRGTLLRWFRNLVISKGLKRSNEDRERDGLDSLSAKRRLANTVDMLANRIERLRKHIEEDVEELVPHVVGGATGMQELVDDLMICARFAGQSAGTFSGVQESVTAETS